MSLLSICQQIARETGFQAPSSIVNNSNELARRLLAVMQNSGKQLAKGRIYNAEGNLVALHDWQVLRKEETFNTSNGTESYAFATTIIADNDFERFVNDTWWDRTDDKPLKLVDAQQWQKIKGSAVTVGIQKYFTVRGNNVLIAPTPTSTNTIALEYISTKWCESSGGTDQAAWADDTDTGIISEDLLTLDGKWRFLQAMGYPYAEERKEAADAIMVAAAQDGGQTALNLFASDEVFYGNIPETGFSE